MKPHRFDPFSFLFGALFLTIGLTVATGGSGADAVRPFRSWPAAVILTGLVLVTWTVVRVLRPGTAEAVAEGEAPAGAFGEGSATEPPAEPDLSEADTAELDETPPP